MYAKSKPVYIACQYWALPRFNLFKAKHMYTCDFFPKKMFILIGFFHWYGFGMVPGLNLCIYFSKKCPREADFLLKYMHKFCPGTTFLCMCGFQVVNCADPLPSLPTVSCRSQKNGHNSTEINIIELLVFESFKMFIFELVMTHFRRRVQVVF